MKKILICLVVCLLFTVGYILFDNNVDGKNEKNAEIIANQMVWLTVARVSESLDETLNKGNEIHTEDLTRLLILYSSLSQSFSSLAGVDVLPVMESGRATGDFLNQASKDGYDEQEIKKLKQVSGYYRSLAKDYALLYNRDTGEMNVKQRDNILNTEALIISSLSNK